MAKHKIDSTFDLRRSKDSSWQEWADETETYFDDRTGKLSLQAFDSFDNARNKADNYKHKVGEEKQLSPEDLTERGRTNLRGLLESGALEKATQEARAALRTILS